ncbi:ABC-2 family transporter protein [Ruminococcaceae bacterium OttesenSCG-928-O06]|nr:ABC-2 family transporter protein [Ruminococcaceae bacterium OttesenSCG-928-O06]
METKPATSVALLRLRQAVATAGICARQTLAGGLTQSLGTNLARLARLFVFCLLWKGLARAGADLGGMQEGALLTYTLVSFAFRPQLDIVSPATASLWEGSVIGRYTRPMPVYISYIAETVGRWWLPFFALFALPALLAAPLFGVSPLPQSAAAGGLFLCSLVLSIVIGFALDLIFAALAMFLKNAMWMATRIREAVYNLLSGALIPFALMPAPVGGLLGLLPFGSVASAPLSIYVGAQNAPQLLLLQLFWAVVLWPAAHLAYKKAEERMVSYGG